MATWASVSASCGAFISLIRTLTGDSTSAFAVQESFFTEYVRILRCTENFQIRFISRYGDKFEIIREIFISTFINKMLNQRF